jgi:hypothetical protein
MEFFFFYEIVCQQTKIKVPYIKISDGAKKKKAHVKVPVHFGPEVK